MKQPILLIAPIYTHFLWNIEFLTQTSRCLKDTQVFAPSPYFFVRLENILKFCKTSHPYMSQYSQRII